MVRQLKSSKFIAGALFCLASSGVAINFWLRSKPIEIPVIVVFIIGLVMMLVEFRSARYGRSQK